MSNVIHQGNRQSIVRTLSFAAVALLIIASLAPLATATGGTGTATAKINAPANGSTFTRISTIQFQDGSTATGCTLNSWTWNFGDGTSSTTRHPTHVYANLGTYTYSLTVDGPDCAAPSSASRTLHIANIKPRANLSLSPLTATAGTSVTLTGAASTDQDGTVTTYRFTLDGALQPDQASATYDKLWTVAGNHAVSLHVVDNDGGQSNSAASHTVNVQPAPLHHLAFTTAPASTNADTAVTFVANAYDEFDNLRSDAITYSLDSGSGSISAGGVFTPSGVGTTVVRAASGSVFATASITVTAGALHHLTFTTAPTTTDADTTQTFVAQAYDANNNPRSDPIAYSLSSGSGSVDATTGLFTPDQVGTTVIQAASNGVTQTASLAVTVGALHHVAFTTAPLGTDADTPVTFVAQAYDAKNNPRTDAITYSLVAGSSGSVHSTTGVFTPELAGSQTVRATAGGFHADASLTVTFGGLDHVAFVTAPTTTNADTPVTFVAQGRDQFGNARPDVVSYSLVSGSGSIDPSTGVFTPDLVGDTVIRATTGTETDDVTLAVTVGALHHVAFSLAPVETSADTPVTFAAQPFDQRGNLRPDTLTYTLASGSGSIGATSGQFVPSGAGVTTIQAAAGTVTNTTSIAVGVGALHHVTFTTAPTSTDADTPVTFVAQPYDQFNNLRADAITYSLVGMASGSLHSTSGLYTPQLVGSHTVRASAGGLHADATITVTVGALDHVTFTTVHATTAADVPRTFVAQGRDQFDNPRSDAVTYSLAAGTGTVGASNGVFTPFLVGTSTIRAAIGSVNATTDVLVTVGALDHVFFTLAPPDTDIHNATTFQARPYDVNGNERTDAITYSADVGSIHATTGVYTPTEVGWDTITATATGTTTSSSVSIVVGETPLDHVTFTHAPATTTADVAVQFSAEPRDAFENLLTNPISFTKLSGSGSIDEFTGLFTPALAGPTVIRATAGSKSATTTITVQPGPLHHIDFTTAHATTNADTPVTFVATAYDVGGNQRSDVLTYSVLSGSGTIDPATGVFTPALVGTTTIKVASGGVDTTTTIAVTVGALDHVVVTGPASTDADSAVTFTGQAYDAKGNPRSDVVTFSLAGGSGTVDETSGLFTPNLAGTSTVQGSAGAVSDTADINVVAGALASVAFTTEPASTNADDAVTFVATPYDAKGNARADAITYSVLSGAGSIDGSGLFTPTLVGTSVIQASVGGFTDTASIAVTVGSLASVVFTQAPAGTDADHTATFQAEPRDQHGNLRTDALTYSVDPGSSGSIDPGTGVFTPALVGTQTLRATAGTVSGTATIVVTVGALDHVDFVAPPTGTDADTAVTLVAKAFDQHGNERTDAVTYHLLDGTGTVDETTGGFVPDLVGTVTVEARSGSESAQVQLLVTVGALAEVRFSQEPSTTDADTAQTFLAFPYDGNGNLRDDAITYAVVGGTTSGSIDATTGVFAPNLVGTATVEAAAGAFRDTATIAVTVGQLAEVDVDGPATTDADTAVTFTAATFDAKGNARSGDAVTFSVASGSGTIDPSTGLFAPNLVGTTVVKGTSGAVEGEESLEVTVGALDHLTVQGAATTDADQQQTFTATTFDAKGNLRSGDLVTWAVLSGSGDIDPDTGVFTPQLVGTTVVEATSGPALGSSNIVVTPGDLASVLFVDGPASLNVGETVGYRVDTLDQHGNDVTATCAWSASLGTVSGTSNDATYTGVAEGVETLAAACADSEANQAEATQDVDVVKILGVTLAFQDGRQVFRPTEALTTIDLPVRVTLASGRPLAGAQVTLDIVRDGTAGATLESSLDQAEQAGISSLVVQAGCSLSAPSGAGGVAPFRLDLRRNPTCTLPGNYTVTVHASWQGSEGDHATWYRITVNDLEDPLDREVQAPEAPEGSPNGIVMMVHGQFAPRFVGTEEVFVPPAAEAVAATLEGDTLYLHVIPYDVATGRPVVVGNPTLTLQGAGATLSYAPNRAAETRDECVEETTIPNYEGPVAACLVFAIPAEDVAEMPVVLLRLDFTRGAATLSETYNLFAHYLLHGYHQNGDQEALERADAFLTVPTPFVLESAVEPPVAALPPGPPTVPPLPPVPVPPVPLGV